MEDKNTDVKPVETAIPALKEAMLKPKDEANVEYPDPKTAQASVKVKMSPPAKTPVIESVPSQEAEPANPPHVDPINTTPRAKGPTSGPGVNGQPVTLNMKVTAEPVTGEVDPASVFVMNDQGDTMTGRSLGGSIAPFTYPPVPVAGVVPAEPSKK